MGMRNRNYQPICVGDTIVVCDCDSPMDSNISFTQHPKDATAFHKNNTGQLGISIPSGEPQYFMVPEYEQNTMRYKKGFRNECECRRNRAPRVPQYVAQSCSGSEWNYGLEECIKPRKCIFPCCRRWRPRRREKNRGANMQSYYDQSNPSPSINYDLIFERIDRWGGITKNLIEGLSKDLSENKCCRCNKKIPKQVANDGYHDHECIPKVKSTNEQENNMRFHHKEFLVSRCQKIYTLR